MKRLAVMLAAVLAAAVPAHADNALSPERIPTKARALADKGRTAHESGDYEAAVAAFKEAYVLAPSPGLLFNIAQSYRLAGNCDESAWMYRRFLDTNPNGSHRKLAEQHLSNVERCSTGALRVTVAPPPKLETKLPEPKPVIRKTPVEPALDTRTTVISDDRSGKYKKLGLVVGIGGAAALAGAAVFAVDARDAAKQVEETYKRGGKWSDIADDDARGRRSSAIATALGIGGGVAAASGVVLWAVGRHYEPAQHFAVSPTPRGAQVSLSWGF